MFERFTKDARTVVERAVAEAAALGAPAVDGEHLLLAALTSGADAVEALRRDLGVSIEAVREAVTTLEARALRSVGVDLGAVERRGGLAPRRAHPDRLPFAPGAKRALEGALRVASARGDRRIGAEHVLLGVLADGRGTAARALDAAGADVGRALALRRTA